MRLIDADALREYACGKIQDCVDCQFFALGESVYVCEFLKALNEQQTIEAEPVKRGKWVRITDMFYKCSECERAWDCQTVELCGINYCPNCGARMVEE